jgi:hypothetical protein
MPRSRHILIEENCPQRPYYTGQAVQRSFPNTQSSNSALWSCLNPSPRRLPHVESSFSLSTGVALLFMSCDQEKATSSAHRRHVGWPVCYACNPAIGFLLTVGYSLPAWFIWYYELQADMIFRFYGRCAKGSYAGDQETRRSFHGRQQEAEGYHRALCLRTYKRQTDQNPSQRVLLTLTRSDCCGWKHCTLLTEVSFLHGLTPTISL